MMEDVMVCLVGEQPLANLLPVRFDEPKQVVLAYTEKTQEVSTRLEKVLRAKASVCPVRVPPFDIPKIRSTLEDLIMGRDWKSAQIVFNLTGGTKAMGFAAYGLAAMWRTRFVYLEGEEPTGRLYRYHFSPDGVVSSDGKENIPCVISLDDYLKAHLSRYWHRDFSGDEGGEFEKCVYQALAEVLGAEAVDHGIQAGGALDIDVAFCYHNQLGIAEVKTGGKARSKNGLSQLNTAGRREYLGTYIRKFLIVDVAWDHTLSNLTDLAAVSGIRVIQLPSYGETGSLSDQDRNRLVREVSEAFGCE